MLNVPDRKANFPVPEFWTGLAARYSENAKVRTTTYT